MPQNTCPEASLMETFLSQDFPNDSTLYQVDKNHRAHKGSGMESWVTPVPGPMVGEHPPKPCGDAHILFPSPHSFLLRGTW